LLLHACIKAQNNTTDGAGFANFPLLAAVLQTLARSGRRVLN
jgi:hypothetical protein